MFITCLGGVERVAGGISETKEGSIGWDRASGARTDGGGRRLEKKGGDGEERGRRMNV